MFDFLEHPSDMYMNSTMRGLFIASLIMVYVVYKKGSRLDKISLVVAFLFAWPFWMVLFFTNGPLSVYHAVTAMFAAGYTMIIFYPLTLIVIWLFRKPIPPELKNIEGVKLFQDWLDINHAGWATGFPNGKLNKGSGYGKFGPRTQKAWALYGKEYLQSLTTPTEVEGDSAWMKSQKEKIRSEKPNQAFTAPIQKVGTPLQSAQNPAPTVNQGVSQLKPQ